MDRPVAALTGDAEAVLLEWTTSSRRALNGHYNSARRFEDWARRLTIASLVTGLLAAVLTASVVSLENPTLPWRLAAVAVAAAASGLGLTQSQLNFGTRAAQHLAAGVGYSRVRRELQILDRSVPDILGSGDFQRIVQLYSEVSRSAPTIPTPEWKEALRLFPRPEEVDAPDPSDDLS